ncbi:hypothetical protein [Candidatus Mycoplasma haematohominis]|uniref:Uncharacterized protein n=1 Tax=Candidatus Mycoplasma haematohominis TaxID=1494318 RepID=A0A478FR76_9MOLU|nr:hypothetical protein [Candidatus Mycoplasma haemohominis]GCE63657.1 hypothetical protein MHSWG343_06570 [Candidatus Mycoplasma haemohominis]
MNPTQAAAGAAAGTAIIGGSYLGYKYLSISCTTIANSVNKDSYAAGTIGGDNKDKFVDPLLADNEGWWKGVFEALKQEKSLPNNDLSVEFNAVTEGFQKTSGNSTTHLNKVCDTAIRKT